MNQNICFFLLNIISFFNQHSVSSAHKQTGFQGKLSLLSQEELLAPFPSRARNNSSETISNYDHPDFNGMAILSADREFIKDGGNIKIMAELSEIETSENDYFTIQCGPTINNDDILDMIPPSSRSSFLAEVEIYDLTFLRCDYKFGYVSFDAKNEGTKIILGEIVVPSEESPTTPKQPHLVYSGIPSKMKVMYVSSSSYPSPSVKYGRSNDSETNWYMSIGTSATYNHTQMCEDPANQVAQNLFRDPGFTHTVEMDKLTPDTSYSYRVGNKEGWSDIFTFQSAPDITRTVSFVAFGDQDIEEAAKTTSYYVKKEIEENGSEFILHFGDLGYAESKGWVWDRWGSIVSPAAAIVPYMTSVGNHELGMVSNYVSIIVFTW